MPPARIAAVACALVLALNCALPALAGQRFDGLNVIVTPGHRFGTASARESLAAARRLGASAVAIVPFLWQAHPADPGIRRGDDMSDDELRAAIHDAHALGLAVMVKPHIWVPHSWAGAVAPRSEADWRAWFAGYRTALLDLAALAAEERVEALVIGTEVSKTSQRPEWFELIAAARALFPGTLLYVAHNADEAETVPFWNKLDAIGVTLYPKLGTDRDHAGRLVAMRTATARLDQLAARTGRPVVVGEIGLRSAEGATAKPWESAEERVAKPDPVLQAEVIADWLAVLRRPNIQGVLIWRWFTDPAAGGLADTDFTVQGKPAQGVLLCAWSIGCVR